MAADLFDYEMLDGSNPLPVHVENSSALDVVTLDERVARSRRRVRLCHSLFPPIFGSTAPRIGRFRPKTYTALIQAVILRLRSSHGRRRARGQIRAQDGGV